MTRANWTSATAWLDRPPPFHPWKLFFKAYPTKSLSLPLYPTIFSLYPSGLSHSLSTTHKHFATGRLCLQAFSPYPVADWVNRWPEVRARELRGQLDEIVDYLAKAATTIAGLVEEGERQAEIRRREWEEERRRLEERWERERQEKTKAEARQELLEAIRS
ncbi:TPA: hypothetical protein ACKPZ8_002825 [Pseudomonas aeruginosa]